LALATCVGVYVFAVLIPRAVRSRVAAGIKGRAIAGPAFEANTQERANPHERVIASERTDVLGVPGGDVVYVEGWAMAGDQPVAFLSDGQVLRGGELAGVARDGVVTRDGRVYRFPPRKPRSDPLPVESPTVRTPDSGVAPNRVKLPGHQNGNAFEL